MKIYEWVELRSVEQAVAPAVINFCTLSDSMFIATCTTDNKAIKKCTFS